MLAELQRQIDHQLVARNGEILRYLLTAQRIDPYADEYDALDMLRHRQAMLDRQQDAMINEGGRVWDNPGRRQRLYYMDPDDISSGDETAYIGGFIGEATGMPSYLEAANNNHGFPHFIHRFERQR